jgi:hypothetical protein
MRNIVASLLSLFLATATARADDAKIGIEFNDLQSADSGCRAIFVLHNSLTIPVDALTLRVVAFDGGGRANLFLSLDVGTLPIGKTRVLRFDLGKGVACKDVSRLVLDDVIECKGQELDPAKCLGILALSSRTGVPFEF